MVAYGRTRRPYFWATDDTEGVFRRFAEVVWTRCSGGQGLWRRLSSRSHVAGHAREIDRKVGPTRTAFGPASARGRNGVYRDGAKPF